MLAYHFVHTKQLSHYLVTISCEQLLKYHSGSHIELSSTRFKGAHGRYFEQIRTRCTVTSKVAPLYPIS